jgi:hypothetical protein
MAVTATTSEEIAVGAGDVFYKDAAGVWQPVGATMDDNVWRLNQEYFVPDLNGVIGPLMGTDYLQEEICELEVTLAEVSGAVIALIIPGATTTTETSTLVGGGATGGLDAPITAGQYLAIKVDSITNLAVGDYIRVGTTPTREIRRVTRVGTIGVGGTGIDVDFPFMLNHADTETFEEVTGTGASTVTGPTQRRVPSTAYRDWRLDVPGLDGRMTRFFTKNALAMGDKEYSAGDDSVLAPRVTFQARRSGATPAVAAWEIRKELAYS